MIINVITHTWDASVLYSNFKSGKPPSFPQQFDSHIHILGRLTSFVEDIALHKLERLKNEQTKCVMSKPRHKAQLNQAMRALWYAMLAIFV